MNYIVESCIIVQIFDHFSLIFHILNTKFEQSCPVIKFSVKPNYLSTCGCDTFSHCESPALKVSCDTCSSSGNFLVLASQLSLPEIPFLLSFTSCRTSKSTPKTCLKHQSASPLTPLPGRELTVGDALCERVPRCHSVVCVGVSNP